MPSTTKNGFVTVYTGIDSIRLNIDYIKSYTDKVPPEESAKGMHTRINLNYDLTNKRETPYADFIYSISTAEELDQLIANNRSTAAVVEALEDMAKTIAEIRFKMFTAGKPGKK